MKKFSKTMLIIVMLFGLSACSISLSSREESAAIGTPEATEISSPGTNEGILIGTLIAPSDSPNPGQPYADIRIYLGTLLIADDGKTTLARVNDLTSPQTFTDATGHFVFTGLEPAEYIITVQVPPNGLVKLNEPGTGRDQVIKVEGGKITDIGTQEHDLPWFFTPVP